MKYLSKIFIGICLAILIIPLAGMSFWMSNTTSENTPLAKWPSLIEEGHINMNFLSQAGEFFEDHFAFRQDLITANSLIQTSLFNTSPVSKVIYGNNDWLYFNGTIDDYQGQNLLNQRSINNIAHNLGLMQFYCQSQNSQFALMIAPNKNSVYPENMPENYIAGELKNIDNLQKALQKENVVYVDLFELFKEKDEILYFERDTHWNTKGALQAYYKLMDQMGLAHKSYDTASPAAVEHISDLDEMLYPKAYTPETDSDYSQAFNFNTVNEIEDYMSDFIQTENPQGNGSLLMFRDSFGEAILPFLVDNFNQAVFSRLTPYNLLQMETLHPSLVVIEKAERNIKDLQQSAAIMDMPTIENLNYSPQKTNSTIEINKDGSFYRINGIIDPKFIQDDTQIYLEAELKNGTKTTYAVFYTEGEDQKGNGYDVYINENRLKDLSKISIISWVAWDSTGAHVLIEKEFN